jgi:hypothetical protein
MLKLAQLKYPSFPTKVTLAQATVSAQSYNAVKIHNPVYGP